MHRGPRSGPTIPWGQEGTAQEPHLSWLSGAAWVCNRICPSKEEGWGTEETLMDRQSGQIRRCRP